VVQWLLLWLAVIVVSLQQQQEDKGQQQQFDHPGRTPHDPVQFPVDCRVRGAFQ
jgi:hypothetical protein